MRGEARRFPSFADKSFEAAGRDITAGHDLTFSTSTDQNLIDPHLMPISCVTLSFGPINAAYYYLLFWRQERRGRSGGGGREKVQLTGRFVLSLSDNRDDF